MFLLLLLHLPRDDKWLLPRAVIMDSLPWGLGVSVMVTFLFLAEVRDRDVITESPPLLSDSVLFLAALTGRIFWVLALLARVLANLVYCSCVNSKGGLCSNRALWGLTELDWSMFRFTLFSPCLIAVSPSPSWPDTLFLPRCVLCDVDVVGLHLTSCLASSHFNGLFSFLEIGLSSNAYFLRDFIAELLCFCTASGWQCLGDGLLWLSPAVRSPWRRPVSPPPWWWLMLPLLWLRSSDPTWWGSPWWCLLFTSPWSCPGVTLPWLPCSGWLPRASRMNTRILDESWCMATLRLRSLSSCVMAETGLSK